MYAWTQILLTMAVTESNHALREFCETLEETILKTVRQGYYTKDIAEVIEGKKEIERSKYLNTFEFIDKVA